MRKIEPTEHQIQCAIVEWSNNFGLMGNKVGDYLLAIPNGGNRSITEAVRLKKEGVKKGVSDLLLAYPVYRISKYGEEEIDAGGLWLEVKSKKGKLSKSQEDWIVLMIAQGYEARVVYSVDEGIQAIKDYLGMR